MQFFKYAILFVSIVLILDLGAYFLLNVQPASSPENNAITSIITTAGDAVKNIFTQKQAAESDEKSSGNAVEQTKKSASVNAESNQSSQTSTQTMAQAQSQTSSCLEKFNLTEHEIIFYHSNDVHSNAMIPIVSDLSAVYKFYNTFNLWDYEFNNCFNLSGTVPAFVCAGSKEKLEGEVSKSVLGGFCGKC